MDKGASDGGETENGASTVRTVAGSGVSAGPGVAPASTYLGVHLIVELWHGRRLADLAHVRESLRRAAIATGATVLRSEFHDFGSGYGVTGVVLLAESHISIHTWPEHDYAALDLFMCGTADPYKALPILAEAFETVEMQLVEHKRGMSVTGWTRASESMLKPEC